MVWPIRLLGAALLAGLARGFTHAGTISALSRLLASAKAAPDDAADALKQLDTNHNGQIELGEISTFASSKGLDYEGTVKEFANYDKDHDGKLNVVELAGVLGLPAPRVEDSLSEQASPALRSRAANLLSSAPAAMRVAGADDAGASGSARVATVSKIASALALEASKTEVAHDLELKAAEARSQLMVLYRRLVVQARQAGSAAALAKAEELSKNLTALETEALRTEVKAAALRAKMQADVRQVNDLSSIVNEGLGSLHTA